MARIPLASADHVSAVGLNVMSALSNHPEAAKAVGQLAMVSYMSPNLTAVHRELAYLTASRLNSCHY